MAKGKKKRSDGRLAFSFTYDGKRYYVYGYSSKELKAKEMKKRAELEAGTMERVNPTLNEYYKHFTEVRRVSVRESTIRAQYYQYQNAASVAMDGNGK